MCVVVLEAEPEGNLKHKRKAVFWFLRTAFETTIQLPEHVNQRELREWGLTTAASQVLFLESTLYTFVV